MHLADGLTWSDTKCVQQWKVTEKQHTQQTKQMDVHNLLILILT